MIDTLYGHCPEEYWFSICYGNEREGKHMKEKAFQVKDRDAAKQFATSLGSDYNVFVTCGLRSQAGITRGGPDSIAALPAAWLDIDIAYPGDKKPRFRDESEAMQFIAHLWGGFMPSLIVHTGHGFQAWYIFNEPMEPDRLFMERFVRTAKHIAEEGHGVVIDSVYDLSRIMRLAGTWNVKGEIPLSAKVVQSTQVRYDPSDFEDFLLDITPVQKSAISVDCNGEAMMPQKCIILLAENKKFRDAANRKDDGRKLDNSPSSHDLTMANIMASQAVTPQEIVDTLRANRQSRGEDMKHPGYYEATAAKAVDWWLGKVQEDKVKVARCMESGEAISLFNELTGLDVDHLVQYGKDNPDWIAVTTDGREVVLGETDDLLSLVRARTAICNATKVVIPHMKQSAWLNIVSPLIGAASTVDVADTTMDELVQTWLEEYIDGCLYDVTDKEGLDAAIAEKKPFTHDGQLYIHLPSFAYHVQVRHPQAKNPQKMLALRLKLQGFRQQTVSITVNGAVTTRSIWVKPTKN